MKFGCHISIKEGYLGAAKKAYAMNASAFQYFPKNPRSLSVKDFNQDDADLCKAFCDKTAILSVSHSPYPTSLTPSNQDKRNQVIDSLLNDLEISEACGSIGVVVHFGKPVPHLSLLESYQLMIMLLNEVLCQWEGKAKILLENNAGLPGAMGTTFEELVQVRNLSEYPEKIGFCLDTCHAYSCGLWDGNNWGKLLESGMQLGYFEELGLIHLNNSKYAAQQGKDRHASIFGSSGYITENQFDQLIKSPQLADIPFILETPKEEFFSHEKEIQLLQKRWGP